MQPKAILKKWLKKHPRTLAAVRVVYEKVRFAARHAAMFFVGRLRGIQANKVVFSSFWGAGYNDNPRYVSEKLHELAPGTDIVWLLNRARLRTAEAPDYVRRVRANSWAALAELATAHAWVDNLKKSQSYLFRRDRQVYFNTWHGDRGFKKVGRDNDHKKYHPRTERFCDAMIAGSEFGARTYRTAFEYEGTILMDGCPRNDLLVRDDRAEAAALRKRMGLPRDAKLMIYAPTFRDSALRENQAAELDLARTLDRLQKRTGDRWLCLMRAHFLSGGVDTGGRDERIVDMTGWPEMAELLLVADLLVTDYSSCAGDFILRDKPAILYQPDLEDYKTGSRELYFDMEKTPFYIARNMDEMEKLIDGLNDAGVKENCRRWREFFGVTETGRASEASARFILKAMGEK